MKIGKMIASVRNSKKISLRELEARTGIRNSHLSELETGKRPNPTWRNIVKISRALDIKLENLAECDA